MINNDHHTTTNKLSTLLFLLQEGNGAHGRIQTYGFTALQAAALDRSATCALMGCLMGIDPTLPVSQTSVLNLYTTNTIDGTA